MIRIILFVDDPNSARDIQNRLQRVSCDVTAMTATADEVITRADELRPDVILMDVRLKGETDGVEVARQIKNLHDIPIIFITANADEATVRRTIAAEPDGVLIMPLDALELRAAIEIAIHRHGTETKARESDRRIRELTESLSEVIFETDMAGNITFVNQAGLKEFGYTKEQVEGGMTLYDFVPPDKREEIRESIAQAVIDEPSAWIAVPGLRRDGSTFPVSVRASLIVREGVPVGIRGIALNVTEQKRAEQQREDSERQLRELTDALPEIVFETDVGGTFTFLNPMGLDSLGYTEADLKKQLTIEDLIIPADLARARENFRKRLDGAAAVWAEYTAQRKDRSTFPLSIRTTAVIRDGVVVGARGIAVDITERKHLEEELQIAASFPSENPDPVLRLSGDGALLYANDAGRKVLGEYPDNLDTAGGPMLALLRDAATDALKANAIRQIEVDVADHTLEFSVAPIVERQHVNFYGVDITARKHAEELAREHSQSMEIVNQIAAAGNRATSVESFAETVTTLTLELMHLDVGALYLVDDDARCANLQYVRGVPETTMDAIRTISLDDTLCAAFCVEGRAPHIEDRDESCVLCAAVMGLASHARAPLYHHDVCIGELHVGSLTRHAFSQAEKELLIAVGNEVGTVIAKLQADDALKESEQRFRELTDALPVGVYETDETGRLTFVNAMAFDLFGYTKEELEAGMTVFQLFTDAHKERAHTVFRRRMSGEDVGRIEYAGLRKDGSTFPVSIRAVLMRRDGAVVGMRGIIVDIAELKRAEDEIKASLKERETLLKEIHHRVKNNMQVVSSLLSLQAAQATEPETIEILDESQRQIRSMALIHEKLYRSGSLAEIDFGDYVKSLVDDLLRMYNVPGGAITIAVDIENVQLGVDTAIPCGLIINELVSNSLKYAFPDGRTGDVTVALQRANGVHTLTVADDGVGFPADLDFRATDSLGMQLVTALVNQLEGTITLDRTKGTTFIITFKSEGARVEKSGGE